MSKTTFLFYDLETTGLNLAFDQVLQFAAIRTDKDLNELSRHEIRVKLRPDVIPSPYAVITHLIPPTAMTQGESEFSAIQQIHSLLNQPGTISLGYNTLGFDDEFLRFSFYRNLLPPYTHQFANNCYRADLFPVAVLYYLFDKNIKLNWPQIADKVSLKLENLNKANQLASGQAHDAMVDVEATVALAKRLKQSEAMWQYCLDYFKKNIDAERVNKLPLAFPETNLPFSEGLLIASNLGATNAFQAPVLCLGQHTHYKNQLILLRLDLEELSQSNLQDFEKTTWVIRKKLGEPGFLLPAKPRFLNHLDKQRITIANKNKAWLLANPAILQAITDYYLNYQYPIVPNADVDSILYQNGFLSNYDNSLCQQFQRANIKEKINLITQFESAELQELAIRLIARNFSVNLPNDYQTLYQKYLDKFYNPDETIIDYRQQIKFNLTQAEQEVLTLKQNSELSTEQKDLLLDYEKFLQKKKESLCNTG